MKPKSVEVDSSSIVDNAKTNLDKCYKCWNIVYYVRYCNVKSMDTKDESYETKYKRLIESLKKLNLGSKVLLTEEEK